MFIVRDLTSVIIKTAQTDGWGDCGIEKMGKAGILTCLAKNGVFVAVCPPLNVHKSLDDAFVELQNALNRLKDKFGVFPQIISQGSPSGIRPPGWFMDWIHQNRIEIVIKREEDIILDAHRAGVLAEDVERYF